MQKTEIIVLFGYDSNGKYIQKPVPFEKWDKIVGENYEFRKDSNTQYILSPEGEATCRLLGCDNQKIFGETTLEEDEYVIFQVIVKGEGDDTEKVKVSMLSDIVKDPTHPNIWEPYDVIITDYDEHIMYFRGAFKSITEAEQKWFEQELA